MKSALPLIVATAALAAALSQNVSAAETQGTGNLPTNAIKEILLRQDGEDRHWVIKSNTLILEEHGLTAHGDLHVLIEYPQGVKVPQMDAPKHDTNAVSVATVFWRNGKRMARTPQFGGLAHGQDSVWWPNGQLAREAHFVMGKPDGAWKYLDEKGLSLGEGSFALGSRQSGVFFGKDSPGGGFFFTSYPMKKSRYEQGQLKEEADWLKELRMQ